MASKSNTTLVSEKGTEKGSVASAEGTPAPSRRGHPGARVESLLHSLFRRPAPPPPEQPPVRIVDDAPRVFIQPESTDSRELAGPSISMPLHGDLYEWKRQITVLLFPERLPEALVFHTNYGLEAYRQITPATWDTDYAHLCAAWDPAAQTGANVRVTVGDPWAVAGDFVLDNARKGGMPRTRLQRLLFKIFKRPKKNRRPKEPKRYERAKKKKPVIYLFPPAECEVAVRVTLPNSVAFTALYPPPVKSSPHSVQWDVTARPSGILTTRVDGPASEGDADEGVAVGSAIDASYLYWEADVDRRAARDRVSLDSDMASVTVEPGNSALVPIAQFGAYLDTALKALGLDVEPRTSFITFWLPEFDSDFVALRFLPQETYDAAVPMDISPAPDAVTRVFALFRNVAVSEAAGWPQVRAESWRDIVCPPAAERQRDAGLFRAVEWGGMVVRGEKKVR